MPKITFVDYDGSKVTANPPAGGSLMEAAVAAGVKGIVAECGGVCACATCHCYVDADWFDQLLAPDEMEADMLEFVMNPKRNSRLSCQIKITDSMDGLMVQVPESQT